MKTRGPPEQIEIPRKRMIRGCPKLVPQRQPAPVPPDPLLSLVVQVVKKRRPPPLPPHTAMHHDQPDKRRQPNRARPNRPPTPHPNRPNHTPRKPDKGNKPQIRQPIPPLGQNIALFGVTLAAGCVEVASVSHRRTWQPASQCSRIRSIRRRWFPAHLR